MYRHTQRPVSGWGAVLLSVIGSAPYPIRMTFSEFRFLFGRELEETPIGGMSFNLFLSHVEQQTGSHYRITNQQRDLLQELFLEAASRQFLASEKEKPSPGE